MAKNAVPTDFKRFVMYIETHQQIHVHLVFSSVTELEHCAAYFFERAVLKPDFCPKFAEVANRRAKLFPQSQSDTNFRKVLTHEAQKQLTVLIANLESASNVTLEKAIGIHRFYGELFNVGFIGRTYLKTHLDTLNFSKDECFISNKCFYHLTSIVKNKVFTDAEEDHSFVVKSLVEIIENAEKYPVTLEEPKPNQNKPKAASKSSAVNYPPINGGFSSNSTINGIVDKVSSFKRLLEDLSPKNAPIITKRIEEIYNIRSDDGTWQLYYEALINKALDNDDLAEPIVELCQKLSRSQGEAWQGVKSEDYKKYIHSLVNMKIKKMFAETDDTINDQIFNVINLIEKLLEQSLCSIGNVSSFVDNLMVCSESNAPLASQILLKLINVVRTKINVNKIKKISIESRKKVFQLLLDHSGNNTIYLKDIAIYLDVDFNHVAVKYVPINYPSPTNHVVQQSLYGPPPINNGVPMNYPGTSNGVVQQQSYPGPTNGIAQQQSYPGPTSGIAQQQSYPGPTNGIAQQQNYPGNSNNGGVQSFEAKTNGFLPSSISPRSSPKPTSPFDSNHEVSFFDHSSFVEKLVHEISFNNIDSVNQAIRFASVKREWNLQTMAQSVYDRFARSESFEIFLKLCIVVNNETSRDNSTSFKDILTNIAMKTLSGELSYDDVIEPDSDESAVTAAEIISRLYQINWISMDHLFRCAESIASNKFQQIRRVKIFYALIKPLAKKLSENACDDRFLYYLQMIRKRKSKATNTKCEIVCQELIDLLEGVAAIDDSKITLEAVAETNRKKNIELISTVLSDVDLNDIDGILKKIISVDIKEIDELDCLVDTIIVSSMGDPDKVLNHAILASKLDGLKVQGKSGSTTPFKLKLIDQCHHKFLDYIRGPIETKFEKEVLCFVRFIAELYKLEMLTLEFIFLCMDMFFRNEAQCPRSADCIKIMITAIGSKIEAENKDMLNRYFEFFKITVGQNGHSYRSKVYKELIAYRENKWSEPLPEPPALVQPSSPLIELKSLVINIDKLENSIGLDSTAYDLKQHLTSAELCKIFVTELMKRSFPNYIKISLYAKLFKELAGFITSKKSGAKITFNECLVEAFHYECYQSSPKRSLNEAEKIAFQSYFIMAGELYRQNVFLEEDLSSWLLHKHISVVTLPHLTYLSSVVAPRIQSEGSKRLKTIYGLLETTIHDSTMEMCYIMKDDLKDLISTLQFLKDYSVNNPEAGSASPMIGKY